MRVIDLTHQEHVALAEIARTISYDPALTSKILSTVNSAFYAQARAISTVSQAMVVLGMNSVKTLVLGFSLIPQLKNAGGAGFNHLAFWKRSIYSAVAARALAHKVGLAQKEEMFLAGLLQDLGMLAMSQTLGAEYSAILQKVAMDHSALLAIERKQLVIDHAQIGAALAIHWKLPPVLVEPIRLHHEPQRASPELSALVRCVALSGRAADVFICPKPAEALENFYVLAMEWFNIPREQAETLMANIHKSSEEVSKLLEISTVDETDTENLLSRANETLLEINLQQQAKTAGLEQENHQLAEQVATDGLTGLANRRGFHAYVAAQLEKMRSAGKPLSLLFLDIDNFKKFNDIHGHQMGDNVLERVSAALQEALVQPGLLARYGGEEFIAVLPGIDLAGAAKQAELLRRAVTEVSLISESGEHLSVTISAGAATAEARVPKDIEELIKEADQGVYAAKAAGKNCVRIHNPNAQQPGAAAGVAV